MKASTRARGLMAQALGMVGSYGPESNTFTHRHQEPDNRGRRTEKTAERLAKAETKRARKAARRLATTTEKKVS